MRHQSVTHKQGGTFEYTGIYSDPKTGEPLDLTGHEITSSVCDLLGNLVDRPTVTIADQSIDKGHFRLRSDNSSSWPVGDLLWDVVRRVEDTVDPSPTVIIDVEKMLPP